MLGMAFFKSLVKEHGKQFFEPIGKALARRRHQEAEPAQPGPRLEAPRRCMAVLEMADRRATSPHRRSATSADAGGVATHAEFAARFLQKSPRLIDGVMRKHQLALADRQCRMVVSLAADSRRGDDPRDEPLRQPPRRRAGRARPRIASAKT